MSTFGFTYFITRSDLFRGAREKVSDMYRKSGNVLLKYLETLINCVFCCSVWAALIMYILHHYQIDIIIYMFTGGASSLIIYNFVKTK